MRSRRRSGCDTNMTGKERAKRLPHDFPPERQERRAFNEVFFIETIFQRCYAKGKGKERKTENF
jgi:hypothetical protein